MPQSQGPLISIVVPVLNGAKYIAQCLESVLAQTYQAIEVIVVDNASTDATVEIASSFDDSRIKVLVNTGETLSIHKSWARAIGEANGEFVKLVCHDDLLEPDCIRHQVDLLLAHPNAALTACRRRIIDDNSKTIIGARGLGPLLSSSAKSFAGADIAKACVRAGTNVLGEPACILIRRSALPQVLFYQQWRYTIDIEFYLRCLDQGLAVVDGQVLCSFRISPGQLSAKLASDQASELKQLFVELSKRYSQQVTPRDVLVGSAKARLFVAARKALYLRLRMRQAYQQMRGMSSDDQMGSGANAKAPQ